MCLILVALDAHPDHSLVVAANRDEFYERESLPMHWWDDLPILGGRDLRLRGGWLTLSRSGRFGAVTNVRDFTRMEPKPRSRGDIPVDFCAGTDEPEDFLRALPGDDFAGYNALVGTATDLWWSSNYPGGEPQRIEPGFHGVSNASLDTAWPKVVVGRERLSDAVAAGSDPEYLFALLSDRTEVPDDQLPTDTGAPIEIERLASAAFLGTGDFGYGTNAQTVLRVRRDGSWDVQERRFQYGQEIGRVSFSGDGQRWVIGVRDGPNTPKTHP